MKRKLTDLFIWDERIAAVEVLDWDSNPDDFGRLCDLVISRIRDELAVKHIKLQDLLTEEVRENIQESVKRFKEKYLSIFEYSRIRLDQLVLSRRKEKKI